MTSSSSNPFLEALSSDQPHVLWCGYIHGPGIEQESVMEYGNVNDKPQVVKSFLLTLDGKAVPGAARSHRLLPGEFLKLEASQWARQFFPPGFQGQIVLSIEDDDRTARQDIMPAVTTHWSSKRTHCEVASQGYRRLNTPQSAGKVSFFMFCPVVRCSAEVNTIFPLFNHSTNPAYSDELTLTPILRRPDGNALEGSSVRIAPFGAAVLDLSSHFKGQAEDFLKPGGIGSLTVAHVGHIIISYFLHIDRATGLVLDGQHTQPPANVLHFPGIWWGRLRQLVT